MSPTPSNGRVLLGDEPGAGITVSDGLHVARTDPDGAFELPGHGPFVIVTRPTGWTTDAWYQRAGADLTFRLSPDEQPVPFSFIQITDLHVSLGDPTFGDGAGDATFFQVDGTWRERIVTTPDVLAELLDEIAAAHPDAWIVATGDLTNTGSDAEYEAFRSVIARARSRVVPIPGNHDLMPQLGDGDGSADTLYAAVTARYEQHLGPRAFSFDHGGVHLVVMDWFTHLLGIDREVQEAWLAADLEAAGDMPTVFFTHDQMRASFYESLARAPVASFSGHWHTSRVVAHAGSVHYNSAPATFGGLDYTPASYRVATWDGARLRVKTVARGDGAAPGATFRSEPAARGAAAWVAALDGGAHLGPPVVHGDSVLATSKREDEPGGALASFDAADGSLRWRVMLGSAVKAAPVVVGEVAIAAAVTGETVCVEIATGAERWRTEIADPLLLWTYLRPTSDGARVFVGDVARFVALDIRDGSVVWARDDLGKRENLTAHAHPVVADDTLLVSFTAQIPDLWGLDPATGATRWPAGVEARSVYQGSPAEIVSYLPRTPVGALAVDPDGADVYVVRLGSILERLRAADGTSIWSAPFHGWFNPARPAVTDELVVVPAGTGSVFCFDRRSGALRWRTVVGRDAPVAVGPYRASGAALLAGAIVVAGVAIIPSGDGRLIGLSCEDGHEIGAVDLGVPLTSRAAVAGDQVVVAAIDGTVRALPLDRLGVEDWRLSSLYV